MSNVRKIKVNIYGAGISGLTVAHELIEKGFDVTVYEKDQIAGGMARSLRTEENVPTEHSWRGYGPFYYNTFDIMKRIPYQEKYNENKLITTYKGKKYDLTDFVNDHPGGSLIWKSNNKNLEEVWEKYGYSWHNNNERVQNILKKYKIENFETNSVYDNISQKGLRWYLLTNDNTQKKGISLKDYPYVFYNFSKVILSDNRNQIYYKQRLNDQLRNRVSKKTYNYLVDYLSGPGFGFDKNTMSRGHYAKFIEYNLQGHGEWKVLNQPTSEGWIEPWVDMLKQKGVRFVFNSEVSKINTNNDKIVNVRLKDDQNTTADLFVMCLNPFAYEKILQDSNIDEYEKYMNMNIQNNQISFRLGFNKKIKFKHVNDAFVLLDSPYNITFYAQDEHWKDGIDLGMDGEIKTLWSGTCVLPFNNGSLFGKSALSLTLDELKQEITHQVFESKELFEIIEKSNNFQVTRDDIIFTEIFDDWYDSDTGLKTKNKKWVNNNINEEFRPGNKTDFTNLYVAGSHTKTTIGVWSMESAVESGKLASNIILKKYNKKLTYIYKHDSSIFLKPLKFIDNILYSLYLPNILDTFIIIVSIIIIYKLSKKIIKTIKK